jgi:hypothetical protein
MAEGRDPILLLASSGELPAEQRVWGMGGWTPPEEREGLDWLTLGTLLGWDTTVTRWTRRGLEGDGSAGSRWIVVACDPDDLDERLARRLAARLDAEPLLLVGRAASADRPIARLAGVTRRPEQVGGRSIAWVGPGPERRWSSREPIEASSLELSARATVWATLDGAPVVAARRVGRGMVATIGFHPSVARDRGGAATALLKHLLVWGAGAPVAWHELDGHLVLRMDDPGGAQNVHLQTWSYPKLGEVQWAAVGEQLRRRDARLSIGYVSGWVDDGDPARGTLEVAGQRVQRVPGHVYPSPLVTYHDLAGLAPGTLHDYEAEYRGIQRLRAQGLADIELHGHTHMHPNVTAWARATDRHRATSWYREMGRAAESVITSLPPEQRPLAVAMSTIRRYFDTLPTTVIFPGDDFTNWPIERALGLGLRLVSSYFQALRDRDRFCWTQHVCAPYLDEPQAAWFDAGLPVVGYFHDRDLAVHGVSWLGACLDRWQAAGARRLIDFRELAAVVGRSLALEGDPAAARLTVTDENAPPPLVRPRAVMMRWPGARPPARVHASVDGRQLALEVEALGDGLGRVVLPRSPREPSPGHGAAPAPSEPDRHGSADPRPGSRSRSGS